MSETHNKARQADAIKLRVCLRRYKDLSLKNLIKITVFQFIFVTTVIANVEHAQRYLDNDEFQEAIKEALPLAEQGNPDAMAIVGLANLYSASQEQQFLTAEKYLRKAAYRGHPIAAYNLAIFYHFVLPRNLGKPPKFEEAMKLYYMAAEKGIKHAMSNIAFISFEEGNFKESLFWLSLALENHSGPLGRLPENQVSGFLEEVKSKVGVDDVPIVMRRVEEWKERHDSNL